MCTAITYKTKDHYFGRNLDLEYSYNETVTITPRQYAFSFRQVPTIKTHHAIIGIAYVQNDYPLYYDAVNEKGLTMAGLAFEGNCVYRSVADGKDNIASFELIPWILGQCRSTDEAKKLLSEINITDDSFSDNLTPTPLHWMITDSCTCIVVEQTLTGLQIYDNPTGVLTNNPTFDIQLFNLNNYMNLSAHPIENNFSDELMLSAYSRGMGAIGLPGDLSSASRFARAVFTKTNSLSGGTENDSISQFFHILDSVIQQRGCVDLGGKYELTVYSSCCNTDKGIYYYKTYDNSRITAVDMYKENLDGAELVLYELMTDQDIYLQN